MNYNILKLYLKANKPLVAIGTILVMATSLLAPQVFANFNNDSADLKTLMVSNRTTGSSWQSNTVAASNGDLVSFQVFYHNTDASMVARNTRVRLSYPTTAQNTITVNVAISSDNMPTVYDSVNVVNNSSAQQLSVETSNIRWYPNQTSSPTYISANNSGYGYVEVNIGDIQGCWPYQGYVTFNGTLSPSSSGSYDLSISKLVRNQTSNQSGYSSNVSAYANDRVTFQIQVTNPGNTTVNNVILRDQLPYQLTYVSGSTLNNSSYASDGLTTGGISLGSLSPGASRIVTFDATVNSSYSSQTVTNTAYVRGDSVSERNSSASVSLTTTSSGGNLNIVKTVRNQSGSYSSNYYSDSTSATYGDRVTFQIQVSNNSNFTANNVIVWDNLPSGLSYVPGSARLDGSYASDSLINSSGVNIGSMYAGATRTLLLDATVNNLGTGYNQTLTNYAYVRADQLNERNDSATVYGSQYYYPTPTPNYYSSYVTLTKTVRNLSTNQTGQTSSTNASVGDRLMFTIQLVTPASSNYYNQVNNLRVWDILPAGLTYVAGTARMDGGMVNDTLVSGNGITVGSLFSNQTKTITFEATVNSYGASQTMTNYAYVSGDGIAQQSAFAQVVTGTPVVPTPTITPTPTVKGATIRAITGVNDRLGLNAAAATMIALWAIFFLYFIVEYADFWRDTRFKFILWKLRIKEKAN